MDYKLPKLPKRSENSNKGTFGKVLNISGSEYMTGAGFLSSVSALKVGAGYVELASCERALNVVATLAPEVVLAPLSKIPELISNATVLLIGCGLSISDTAKQIVKTVLPAQIPTVVDADGLNILAKNPEILRFTQNDKKNPEQNINGKQASPAQNALIFTPHPKEASRLLNCELEDVLNDMENSAKKICEKYNCITVLKSHNTIVSDGNKIYRNTTGNSALAKAGSGDVLAGIIAGLLAQKMTPFDASCLGVYIHGLAGDLAKNDLTAYGVLASDTVRYIPNALKKLTKEV